MINELTVSQKQRLIEVREEWRTIGLSTEPVNRERVETVLAQIYGDVLFKPVSVLPNDVIVREDGILARGEATGHTHRLAEATDGLLYESSNGQLFLVVGPRGARIEHEEHEALTRPEGVDKIDRVLEYDHFAEEARTVRD